MTVEELIETLKTCDEKSEVKIEHLDTTVYSIEEVIDCSEELNKVIIFIEWLNFRIMSKFIKPYTQSHGRIRL